MIPIEQSHIYQFLMQIPVVGTKKSNNPSNQQTHELGKKTLNSTSKISVKEESRKLDCESVINIQSADIGIQASKKFHNTPEIKLMSKILKTPPTSIAQEFWCGLHNENVEMCGTKRLADGAYVGMLRNGQPFGYGELLYNDGSMYKGSFVAGKRHGKGEFIYPDGTVFEGQFADDKRNGKGRYVFMSGATHTCMFMNNLGYGSEKHTTADGDTIIGSFSEINDYMLVKFKEKLKAKL